MDVWTFCTVPIEVWNLLLTIEPEISPNINIINKKIYILSEITKKVKLKSNFFIHIWISRHILLMQFSNDRLHLRPKKCFLMEVLVPATEIDKTTRMTTFISSEALWNYIKDIWKILSEIKKKNHATFHHILIFFYISAL